MDIQERTGVHVLCPTGELTIFEAAEFREALVSLCGYEGPIELDLTGVDRVDSSGIQLIMAASQDSRLVTTGMTETIGEKFDNVGCKAFVKIGEA